MSSSTACRAIPSSPAIRLFTGADPNEAGRGNTKKPTPEWRLSELYEQFLLPCVFLPEGRPQETIAQDRLAIGRWRDYAGDPPLGQVDAWTWAEFCQRMRARQWRGATVSQNTVKKTCTHLKKLLGFAGGWRGGNKPPGLGLVELPYLASPPTLKQVPEKDYTLSEIQRLIEAAEADPPKASNLLGVAPRLWWPNLLRFAYNTALRAKSMLGARWDLWDKNRPDWLWLPPQLLKETHEGLDFYMNQAATAAVQAVWGGARPGRQAGPLFGWRGWPRTKSWFYQLLGRIEQTAGLAEDRRFGLKGFRKATLTWLSGENDLVARIVAGHRSGSVLLTNYANRFKIVPRYLDRLPQPGSLRQQSLF
jgi:integrase